MKHITELPKLPSRPTHAHKGTFGTVIVIGGCSSMIGAPALSCRSALRSGVGMVKVACIPSILPFVLTVETGATGIELCTKSSETLEHLHRADPDQKAVLAIGPGLGVDARYSQLITDLLAEPWPIVLDADGLNLLSGSSAARTAAKQRNAPLVLTPHPGEYRRLSRSLGLHADPVAEDERLHAASIVARELCAVVLLKGQHTVISDGQRYAINPTGNPALATAGSGDVLTGLIASLMAQGTDHFDAAQLAAYLHGCAADLWAQNNGPRGIRAVELADHLPLAMNQFDRSPTA